MKAKKTVLVFGNPLVQKDSLVLRLLPKLRKALPGTGFVELDGTEAEEIAEYGPDLIILDAAEGIGEPAIITDLDKLELPKVRSMHDFDLAWNLKLLMKVGKIKSVKIVAVPTGLSEKKAIAKIKEIMARDLWITST